MVLNIKYLVVTIGAVFLSLGIGIMIGFNLNNSEIFSSQQLRLVEDMDSKLTEIRTENESLNLELRESASREEKLKSDFEDFLKASSDIIIGNKLFGKNVALIQTTEDYFFHDLGSRLEKAGAQIGPHILISNDILEIPYDEAITMDIFLNEVISVEKISNLIIESLKNGDLEILQNLENLRVISIINNGKTQAVDNIVLLGGSLKEENERFENIDTNIVKSAKSSGIFVVGAEHTNAIYSDIKKYESLGISTIDNVDQTIGIISLVYTLDGEKGNFGTKATADRLFPNLR